MPERSSDRPVALVVDPLSADRKLLRVLLRTAGWEVREAAGAEEALAEVCESRPAVILVDLGVPVTAGLELVRRMRALPAGAGAVILGTSVLGPDAIVARSRAAGCTDFLPKPLDTRTLAAVLLGLAGRAEGGVDAR